MKCVAISPPPNGRSQVPTFARRAKAYGRCITARGSSSPALRHFLTGLRGRPVRLAISRMHICARRAQPLPVDAVVAAGQPVRDRGMRYAAVPSQISLPIPASIRRELVQSFAETAAHLHRSTTLKSKKGWHRPQQTLENCALTEAAEQKVPPLAQGTGAAVILFARRQQWRTSGPFARMHVCRKKVNYSRYFLNLM